MVAPGKDPIEPLSLTRAQTGLQLLEGVGLGRLLVPREASRPYHHHGARRL